MRPLIRKRIHFGLAAAKARSRCGRQVDDRAKYDKYAPKVLSCVKQATAIARS
jgi:hypothetical protein